MYGSEEDGSAALKSLSTIESEDRHLKEIVISHFMAKYGTLSEVIYQFIFCANFVQRALLL